MTQPSAANAKLVDKDSNPQIADRGSAVATDIVVLTDSVGGGVSNTIDYTTRAEGDKDDISSLTAKINELVVQQNLIIDALEAHGLIADN